MLKRVARTTVFCCLGFLLSVVATSPAEDGTASIVIPTEIAECSREGRLAGLTSLLRNFSPVQGALAQQLEVKEVTPNQVQQATLDMIAEIELLRKAEDVADYPPEAEHQEDRLPIHGYVKSLEVMKKVSRLQEQMDMTPVQLQGIPVRPVLPKDLLGNVNQIIGELRKIKAQLAVSDEIQPAPLEGRTTFSTVYTTLGNASFLLDGLVGHPITPSDVFANVSEIQDELELIAAKLKANLVLDAPEVEGKKGAKEAAQQALRAVYKVIRLQTMLGMSASNPPNLTLVRVTPSEVFEKTSIIWAEVARIKTYLDISLPRLPRPEPRNKNLDDVCAQILLLVRNLDVLTEAVLRVENRSDRVPELAQ